MIDLKTIDCRLVVTSNPWQNAPVKVKCLQKNHTDSEYSLAVYPGRIQCFGCGLSVNRRLDALAYLLYQKYDQETVHNLIRDKETLGKYVRREVPPQPQITVPPPNEGQVKVYQKLLWGRYHKSLSYLLERGLSEQVIREAELGHMGDRFVLPVRDVGGTLLTLRYRRDDTRCPNNEEGRETHKYWGYTGCNQPYLYPASWVRVRKPDTIWLCEGELDALRLWSEGVSALTITNGAGNLARSVTLLQSSFPSIKRIVLCGDQDTPGERAAQKCITTAQEAGLDVVQVLFQAKDITDFLRHHSLKEVIAIGPIKVERHAPDAKGGGGISSDNDGRTDEGGVASYRDLCLATAC